MTILRRYRILDTASVKAARDGRALFSRLVESLVAIGSNDDFRMFVNSVTLDGIRVSTVGTTGHHISPLDPDNVTVLVP
jgi:hypothetical protein